MRILVLASRYPQLGGKGDQHRAFQQISHLAGDHEVTVCTAAAPPSARAADALAALAHVQSHPVATPRRLLAAAGGPLTATPGQVAWMTPRAAWRRARAAAERADVVLASTVRAVRGPVAAPLVLDHVDCLSLNMARRAHGPERVPVRLASAAEARLLRAWERRAAGWATVQVVTAAEDARALPAVPPVHVLPQGWSGQPFTEPDGHDRPLDVVLTGNMAYPPNREAAAWLADEIAPRLRALAPGVEVHVVGRDAARLRLAGVQVASDVPDLHDYLRRARVAVVPLRSGTGAPNKVLEAAGNGAAIVATPWPLERFGMEAAQATTADGFAREIAALLADEARRRRAVAAALPAVREHLTSTLMARLDRLLVAAAAGGDGSGVD